MFTRPMRSSQEKLLCVPAPGAGAEGRRGKGREGAGKGPALETARDGQRQGREGKQNRGEGDTRG